MVYQTRDYFFERDRLIKITDNFLLKKIVLHKQYYTKSKETICNEQQLYQTKIIDTFPQVLEDYFFDNLVFIVLLPLLRNHGEFTKICLVQILFEAINDQYFFILLGITISNDCFEYKLHKNGKLHLQKTIELPFVVEIVGCGLLLRFEYMLNIGVIIFEVIEIIGAVGVQSLLLKHGQRSYFFTVPGGQGETDIMPFHVK